MTQVPLSAKALSAEDSEIEGSAAAETSTTSTSWSKRRRAGKRYGILGLTVIVFGYLGLHALRGVQQVLETGISFQPQFLLISALIQLVGVLLAAAIWSRMLWRFGVTAPYRFNVQVYGVSGVARKIPGTIWYALSRLALYKYKGWPATPVITALVIEMVNMSLGGLIVFVVGSGTALVNQTWLGEHMPMAGKYLPVVIFVFVGVVIWVQPLAVRKFLKWRQVDTEGKSAETSVTATIHMGDSLLWVLGTSIVLAMAAGVIYFFLLAVDAIVPYMVVLSGFGLAVALGPIAIWMPADIGLKDGILYFVLTPFLTAPIAALVVLMVRLWVSLLEVSFGMVCAATLGKPLLHEVFHQESAATE